MKLALVSISQLLVYSYLVDFREVHGIIKLCCLKAIEVRRLADFEKYVFLFISLSPRFFSSIDLQVNASLCCSVKPLISYCYVSAANGGGKKKCIFKEIILGLPSKTKKRKSNKRNFS